MWKFIDYMGQQENSFQLQMERGDTSYKKILFKVHSGILSDSQEGEKTLSAAIN